MDLLKRLHRIDEACSVLQKLKQTHPDNLDIRNQLGWFYLGRNDLLQAKREFESILAIDPINVAGINGMGAVFFNEAEYTQAEEHFRRALVLEPSDAVLHSNLAWALVRQAKESMSMRSSTRTWLESMKQAISAPANPKPNADCLRKAERRCRTALKLDPNYSSTYGCLGIIAFKQRRFVESEDFFLKSIQLNPLDGSYVDLGALYASMGRYSEAADVLTKARELDKTDMRCRLELGNVYLQTERLKEAIQMFREAKAMDPKSEDPPRALALALMKSGEFTEAGQVLGKALKSLESRKLWQLHLTLCQLLTDLADKNDDPDLYKEALKQAGYAVALKPDHPSPYFYSGIVQYKLENYVLALKHFRECLKRDPNHVDAEQNARRVRSLLWKERSRTTGGLLFGGILGVLCFALLMVVWIFYFNGNKRVDDTMFKTMTPLLLGLTFIAFLLPWLSRLKLPGVEAELSRPKEKISSGPGGSVGFGSSSISGGPQ